MNTTTRRMATTLVAATATTLALLPAAQAAEFTTARDCVDADNVWVYVEYGEDSDKEPTGACATEFSNGFEALESAGFEVTYSESDFGRFLTGIDGVAPTWTAENPVFWSYWNGTVAEDYSVAYESYMVGASISTPEAGTVEAWSVSDGSVAPALVQLPAPVEASSSVGSSQGGVLGGLLGRLGGIFAALQSGLFSILGLSS
ncbi:hypothetical protein [Corynebacterium gallinarum]|nr:hypothetical protein [Corynebacterium gallinarum]